jgi:hypothetical protein
MATATRTSSSIILRLNQPNRIDGDPISRVIGYLNTANFISLFETVDLAANPRLPRLNPQVQDMWNAIEMQPEYFHYKNNGILIAASSCEPLERGRFRLDFEPKASELHPRGILNGGHTTFACVTALIKRAADLNEQRAPRIKLWEELKEQWPEWRAIVTEALESTEDFLVPVEILLPADGRIEEYDAMIHEIADARNNNSQLTEETKANHAGYYRELKHSVPPEIEREVEWKTNDGGRVKAKDLVVLACIPLSVVSKEVADVSIDLKQCYNSTAKCSSYFRSIYEATTRPEDAVYVLRDDPHGKLVASAVAMTGQVVELYEWLKVNFPNAYNKAGGNFGLITGVKVDDDLKYSTMFRQTPMRYSYSDGFIMPILTAMTLLIETRGDKVVWTEDPMKFLQRNLARLMKTYKGIIKTQNFDGRLIGRDSSSYEMAYETFLMLHEIENPSDQDS